MGNVQNIKLEPVDLEWSNPEITKVKCLGGAGLDTKSFLLNSALDAADYYVWFDGGGLDPASATNPIAVSIVGTESASAIAALVAAAVDAETDFFAAVDADDPESVVILTKDYGSTTASADVDSLFTISQVRAGAKFALGFTDALEVALSEELVDVIAMQKGATILDKIRAGVNIDPVEVAMKESDAAKLKEILLGSGDAYTPPGGSEVVGIGTGKYATNISADARRLVLHPVRLASGDETEDNVFMLAYPTLSGLNFSGDEEQKITVEFQILPDGLTRDNSSIFVKGEHKQNLLK